METKWEWLSYKRRIRYLPQRLINSASCRSFTQDYKLLIRNVPQLHIHSSLKLIWSLFHPTAKNTFLTLSLYKTQKRLSCYSLIGSNCQYFPNGHIFSLLSKLTSCQEHLLLVLGKAFNYFPINYWYYTGSCGREFQTNCLRVILTEGCLNGCLIWQSAL